MGDKLTIVLGDTTYGMDITAIRRDHGYMLDVENAALRLAEIAKNTYLYHFGYLGLAKLESVVTE